MLKAIIADDEQKICQLIQRLVKWDELDIEIVGTADNGLDAFELICQHQPDIVITDIRMPGLDGLELIKKVKEHNLSPSFIIISGYRHFEYAHNALKYGVEDYLLKPIKKDELVATLVKISDRNLLTSGRIEDEMRMKSILANNRDRLRQHFISRIVFESEKNTDIKMENVNEEYQFKFIKGCFETLIIKLDQRLSSEFGENIEKVLEYISKITDKFFKDKCSEMITYVKGSAVLCVLNYPEQVDSLRKSYRYLYDEVKSYVDTFDNYSLTIGIGSTERNFSDILKSFSASQDAVRYRIALGVDRIIKFDSLRFENLPLSEVITAERERQLANYIEALDKEGFKGKITEVFSYLGDKRDINPCLFFEVCDKIAELVINTMKKNGLTMGNENGLKKKIDAMLDCAVNTQEIHKALYEWAAEQIDLCLQGKKMQDTKPIRTAKQYIAEHYMEQLSLDDIAQVVHFNSAYFCTVFKREVGLNFSDYLINCRLYAAKEFLRDTNLSMAQISEKIGYTDTKYFSKLFNKIVGIKPSEYRKLYS